MDPLVTSTLISTGANLLGGLFGGKGKKGPSPQEQVNANALMQQTIDRNRPSWIVEGAKAAGVHPLVAFGMSPASGPTINLGGGDSGRDWGGIAANLGQDIGRVAEAVGTREDRAADKVMKGLQLKRAALENDLLAAQIRTTNQAGNPPAHPNAVTGFGSSGYDPRYLQQILEKMGYGDQAPLFRKGRDPNGDYVRVYNDDLGDNEVLQALTALGVTIPDAVANFGQRVGRWLREPRFKKSWWTGHGYGVK